MLFGFGGGDGGGGGGSRGSRDVCYNRQVISTLVPLSHPAHHHHHHHHHHHTIYIHGHSVAIKCTQTKAAIYRTDIMFEFSWIIHEVCLHLHLSALVSTAIKVG